MSIDRLTFATDHSRVAGFFKKFSDATRLYISSYDDSNRMINDFTGSEAEVAAIRRYVSDDLIQEMYARLTIDSIEDQIIEDTVCPELRVGGVALKFEGRCKEIWFFAGLIDENGSDSIPDDLKVLKKRLNSIEFLHGVDALREMGEYRIAAELALAQYEEKSRRSLFSAHEMAESLKRVESLTEILKYLDSDSPVDSIMGEFLRITSEYLGVSQSDIFKIKERQSTDLMDIVATYTQKGVISLYDKTTDIERFGFLVGKKSIILSSGATPLKEIELCMAGKVKALIAMPVIIGQNAGMYAVFLETERDRNWQIHELQFLSDAVRVLQNILEKRIQKNSLVSSYASLEQILEHVGCAVIVNDVIRHETLFMNKKMQSLFPLDSISDDLNEIIWEKKDETVSEQEYYDYEKNSWYEIHHSDIHWVDGRPVALYAIYDVTEKKNYQRKIEQQAYTDFLTGLLNRLCCERDLARIIDETKKYDVKGALCFIDLDDFKHINDGLGHQYGDKLLKDISTAIKKIKGIEDTCYRMGGDEFVIIIPPRNYAFYDEIVENIKGVFARPFYLKDGEYYCTMSMGIVTFPDEGDSVDDLVKKADIAMYSAKKTGKNRVAKYNSGSVSDSGKRLDMEKNMRDAANRNFKEFVIYYQPVVDITLPGGICTGAEALIRWNSKELGFISPSDFIPLAEYLGLINPIGNHVLKEACMECKRWNDSGHPNYKVNVNLSVVQLMQDNIVDVVRQTIKETGITPRNLTLEVTESLAINDMERMKSIMTQIRELGVRIALDDFGTGYSSLNHIREIPFDVIKVDQSFVRELATDEYPRSFIRMIGELARALGVDICVEGIEREDQFKALEGMNVRMIQGFYFDKPMSKEDFEEKYVRSMRSLI